MPKENLRDVLNVILNKYSLEKSENFRENSLAYDIRNTYPNIISKCCNISKKNYKVYGSSGKGQWAEVPWIAICDQSITESAQKGYYIVYLFVSDMSGVYVSLNQGWTYYKNDSKNIRDAISNIDNVSRYWRNKLSGVKQEYISEIDLKVSSSALGAGYEHGHILGKYYDKINIPDNQTLIQDLNELMCIYKSLSGQLIHGFEETNKLIINDIEIEWENEEFKRLAKPLQKNKSINLEFRNIKNIPIHNNFETKNPIFKGKDYSNKIAKQKLLGMQGEEYVLEYEKSKLKGLVDKDGRNLSDLVEHTSRVQGDGVGYDILSYDKNGESIFIEVKTTNCGIETPFYITENELMFAKKNINKYYIYRLYDFNQNNNKNQAYCIKGSEIENTFHLIPISYKVQIKSSR